MNIKTRKLGRNKWEMHLVAPSGHNFETIPGYKDINAVRAAAEEAHCHDETVTKINEELVNSDFTMFSRQAYDRWHWYDKDEMNRFVTSFLLKNS